MPLEPEVLKDPWEDDQFAPLDRRTGPEHFAQSLADIANADPENFPPPVAEPAPVSVAPVAAPTYAQPEIVNLEDGSSVSTTEDADGWHAEVDSGNGKPKQIYHARSERELLRMLMVAQANATKKINQQERQIKLIQQADDIRLEKKQESTGPTADQLFEIKTLFQTDPLAAFNKLCQTTAGVEWSEFIKWAKAGQRAEEKQTRSEIAQAFFAARPRYLNNQNNEARMLDYINSRKKAFTVENLIEAYDELLPAGLLEEPVVVPRTTQPVTPPVAITTPVQPVAPEVPAPANVRIERPVGRQSAGFGLPQRETTTVRPPASQDTPSAEDLDNLTDEQLNQLMAGVIRTAAQSGRRLR